MAPVGWQVEQGDVLAELNSSRVNLPALMQFMHSHPVNGSIEPDVLTVAATIAEVVNDQSSEGAVHDEAFKTNVTRTGSPEPNSDRSDHGELERSSYAAAVSDTSDKSLVSDAEWREAFETADTPAASSPGRVLVNELRTTDPETKSAAASDRAAVLDNDRSHPSVTTGALMDSVGLGPGQVASDAAARSDATVLSDAQCSQPSVTAGATKGVASLDTRHAEGFYAAEAARASRDAHTGSIEAVGSGPETGDCIELLEVQYYLCDHPKSVMDSI